jgi:cytochrome c oxidase assembly protein subunit 15
VEGDPAPRTVSATRALALVLLALLVVVTTTTARVRLAQSGLSCADAPDCYATKQARSAAEQSTATAAARTLHRLAASAAGGVIVALFFLGWRTGGRRERTAIVALALLALGLASLGSITPSPLPVVTLANLLGGMAMVGISAWLAARSVRPPPARRRLAAWAWLAVALLAVQIAAGGMIAARHGAYACDAFPHCGDRLWPDAATLRAFDPWHASAPPTTAEARGDAHRQAVVQAHRWVAVPTLLALAWLGMRAWRTGVGGPGRALLALAAVQAALGAGQALGGPSLAGAVAHNVVAAGIAIALGAIIARGAGMRS